MPGKPLTKEQLFAEYGPVDPTVFRISAKGLSKSRAAFDKFFNDESDDPVVLEDIRMRIYGPPKTVVSDRVFFLPTGQIVGWETTGGKADSYWEKTEFDGELWVPQHLEKDAKMSVLGLIDVSVRKPTYG